MSAGSMPFKIILSKGHKSSIFTIKDQTLSAKSIPSPKDSQTLTISRRKWIFNFTASSSTKIFLGRTACNDFSKIPMPKI
jgi:hypothetical protein